MWVQSLGWEDPLEEGTATYSSILAWRILMDRGAWQAAVHKGLVIPQHMGFSWSRDQTCVPCIGRQILNHWST